MRISRIAVIALMLSVAAGVGFGQSTELVGAGVSAEAGEEAAVRGPNQPSVPAAPAPQDREPAELPGIEPAEPVPARSAVAVDVPIPTPPFWGRKVIENIPLADVLPYINETMLFQVQWQFRRNRRPADEFERYLDAEVRPIYRDLVARCQAEQILQPRAVYGYWPCQSEGDTLYVYDPVDRDLVLGRFDLPRQRKRPYWCLADFWRPRSSGQFDVSRSTSTAFIVLPWTGASCQSR